jgi:hypothetical protein
MNPRRPSCQALEPAARFELGSGAGGSVMKVREMDRRRAREQMTGLGIELVLEVVLDLVAERT